MVVFVVVVVVVVGMENADEVDTHKSAIVHVVIFILVV